MKFCLLYAKGWRGIFGHKGRLSINGIFSQFDAASVAEVLQSFELATV
jgi:hypothetical protein